MLGIGPHSSLFKLYSLRETVKDFLFRLPVYIVVDLVGILEGEERADPGGLVRGRRLGPRGRAWGIAPCVEKNEFLA